MKSYNIFSHDEEPAQAVKIGWSWPGFFFNWIWAFLKGMNGLGIGLLLVFALSGAYATESGEVSSSIVPLAAGIWLGLSGNKQREANLRKKGFKHVGEVTASNSRKALSIPVDGD